MVLVAILVSSLITLLILIITSAIYLIALVVHESDDNGHDNLCIDTRDFSLTPVQSPLEAQLSDTFAPSTGNNDSSTTTTTTATKLPELQTIKDNNTNSSETDAPDVATAAANISNRSGSAPAGGPLNGAATATATASGKQQVEDFDQKEMQLGGTGLHWCKTRKSLDRLIKLGLPLEIVNKRQETALHVAIRRHRLSILIGLLNHGANVECRNAHGETPLILACKVNDIFACQALLVYDADCDSLDNCGYSARHYAASICDKHQATSQQQLPSAAHLILAMLNEIGAKRCPDSRPTEMVNEGIAAVDHQKDELEDNERQQPSTTTTTTTTTSQPLPNGRQRNCTNGCSPTGDYNGNSYNRWPNYTNESLYKRYMFSDIIDQRLEAAEPCNLCERTGRPCPLARDRSRLLCIDGGGLRGVIVCQIMIEMERHLKKPMASYFDWIGGTSVGGFLACAMSMGTDLRELRRICFDVKEEVFCGTKPYNAKFLERVLKRTYGATTRMSDIKGKKVAVTTVIADRDPCQLRFFRNYKSAAKLLEENGFPPERFNTMSGHSTVTFKPLGSRKSIPTSETTTTTTNTTTATITAATSSMKTTSTTTTKTLANPLLSTKLATTSKLPISSTSSERFNMPSSDTTTTTNGSNETMPDDIGDDPFVWQAVRASSAAPFFFKPYGPYLDGGLISNNPTLDMLSEFNAYHKVRDFILKMGGSKRLNIRYKSNNNNSDNHRHLNHNQPLRKTKCGLLDDDLEEPPPGSLDFVVSLGTGRGRVIGRQTMIDFGQVASGFATVFSPRELVRSIRGARDLFKKLMQQSCQTEEHILDRAQAWTSSLEIPYFRINPPLTTIFSIDDKRDEQLINALWQTKLYMRAMRDQLTEIGTILDGCNGGNNNQS